MFSNSKTHLIAWYVRRDHKAMFGVFIAKGHYAEIIVFGRTFRVWATPEYK